MTHEERIAMYKGLILPNLSFDPTHFLMKHDFFDAPASTKYHGAYPGGLFDHSMFVTDALLSFTENMALKWQHPQSPYVVGFFHDLCKIDTYYSEDEGDTFKFNDQTLIKGHGEKSVMLLSTLTRLTEEEVACILYHMGAFCEKDKWGDYTRAITKYPNVLWTHTADMLATYVKEA